MSTYKRTTKYFKPYIPKILLALTFMLIVGAATAMAAYLVKPLLDDIFTNGDENMLRLLPMMILGVFFVKGLFQYLQVVIMRSIGQEVIMKIRNELYERYLSLSVRYFSDNATGVLMSRITNDVMLMQQALPATVSIIGQAITVIGLAVVAFYRDATLAFIAFFVFPISIMPVVKFGKKLRRYSKSGQEKMGDLSTILQETFSGVRIVKAFAMEDYEKERFGKENHRYYRIFKKIIKVDAMTTPVMEFIGALGIVAVIYYGGMRVIESHQTPDTPYTTGTFFSFITALIMMYEPIKKMSKVNNSIQQALAAAGRVFEVIDTKPEITDKENALGEFSFADNIAFKDVRFSYEPGEEVLTGTNFVVPKGEVAAFVGSSGAGKTTLVNLIPRFYDVISGAILIDNVDIRDMKVKTLRSEIGMVTQDTFLFNDTIRNNIAYGVPVDENAVIAAANAANAHKFIMEFPDGYNTMIGERGVKISGGQRQRLAIARALLKNPPILILDEATSALDTESEYLVQQALSNLIKDRTTFVIAHRLSTVQNADTIYVLDRGKIVESGKHDELLANSTIYKKLYDMQFR